MDVPLCLILGTRGRLGFYSGVGYSWGLGVLNRGGLLVVRQTTIFFW